ncbi:hypothetical protein PENANT_c045G00499 [Penicillium antarcticum]|uniref:RING-type domain-containing protein n=1 Tax=Penicillium antarcticum TaxID=416450 RepID=A0A1V6PSK6_9EURO|nr:uncharacterized protein N7508_001743 [Penicillium antarcticum]KAJ5317235.1 hypothetical protein N7508_001743 [Penicillium antarcticum]OQD79687.1 hypothetical protein PENANT_c045G00499 [Penicillium antarcticum]
MSSNAGQNPPPSKAVNISITSSPAYHPSAPTDNSSQRRGSSGNFKAGPSSRNSPAPRNNQARKNQHNRQRKPRLLDDDEYNESAAMKSTTSRKGQTSITHLMNFSLPPRPQYQPPPRNVRRYNSWGAGTVDKARYVHANYRFIVMPNQNFHAQAANADVHLDWASVLQVLVSAQTQAASCPICLSTPVAPRMARCGHIFCLPCLIRYMHSSDDDNPVPEKRHRWKKCPICWDSIYISETRPVRWFRGQEGDLPIEGGDVVLRLMKRGSGSTLALPRDGSETHGADQDIPWYHVAEVADYARIMKGGEEYMTSQYESEVEDLRKQEIEDELLFGDENTWTRKAIGSIKDATEKLNGIGNPPEVLPAKERSIAPASTCASSVTSTSTPATSDETDHISHAMDGVHLDTEPTSKSKDKGRRKEKQSSSGSEQPYYFYQALPQFYLSPLDIRILKAAFGEYAQFPATILPRVEHISTGHIVDDELRKRVKYLGHLPQGCEVNFLECDWRDVVVPEILAQFRTETDRRRKRNREKEVREEKDRIRAEKKEDDERWASARRKRPSIGASSEAPFSARDFHPLPNNIDPPLFDAGASSASPPRASSGFGALASPSTSPPGSRTVWGTTAVASLSPSLEVQGVAPSDGWRQGWEDELFAQQESDLMAQTAIADSNPGPSTGGKKKKKNKITLMSTNIQRGA